MPDKILISWSGGKDSALALHEVASQYEIAALLTTVTEEYDRISMHGVRTTLLSQQAAALGLPLEIVLIPPACSNDEYQRRMRSILLRYQARGVTGVVSGDLFLEDLRRYREARLYSMGLRGLFPLWGRDTRELANQFIALGFRAVLCCSDTQVLDARFAGRHFDAALLAELPASVDPCGENGEFHTFVFDGPNFSQAIAWQPGEVVIRDERFAFCDLLPA